MDIEKDQELDLKTLKYVLYARKSTKDESRQVRSIDDQLKECNELIKRLGLNVVATFTEEESAKKPHIRPIFTQILKDLKSGKYDGVIAWNPDRLARNMLEAGQIIDMIDQGQIKDLRFVTHYFTKDANGKMLLGMAFVLSKQYSDDLSQKVTRGVRNNLVEGKSSSFKHGYIRDKDGFYRPNSKNFDFIKKAWQLREQGIAIEQIVETINLEGYYRVLKSNKRKVILSKQTLSRIFLDPFYYGILIQANQQVDLREIPGYNFVPMISYETYINVQNLATNRYNPYRPKKERITYYPLKQMVKCGYCGSTMYPGASKGSKGTRYLYFRCDNKDCTRVKKSVRGYVVFDYIVDFLRDGLHLTEKDYEKYLKSMSGLSLSRQNDIRVQIHSKETKIKYLTSQIKDISYKILDFKDNKTVMDINKERLEQFNEELVTLKNDVAKLKDLVKEPEQEIVTIQQFLNLSKNAGIAIETGDSVIKDTISRLIFLNFNLGDNKVLSCQLKPPFDVLLKTRVVKNGRGDRTRTCDLTVPNRAL